MFKTICLKMIIVFILSALWLVQGVTPARAVDVEFSD
jgi:hypothetical protein